MNDSLEYIEQILEVDDCSPKSKPLNGVSILSFSKIIYHLKNKKFNKKMVNSLNEMIPTLSEEDGIQLLYYLLRYSTQEIINLLLQDNKEMLSICFDEVVFNFMNIKCPGSVERSLIYEKYFVNCVKGQKLNLLEELFNDSEFFLYEEMAEEVLENCPFSFISSIIKISTNSRLDFLLSAKKRKLNFIDTILKHIINSKAEPKEVIKFFHDSSIDLSSKIIRIIMTAKNQALFRLIIKNYNCGVNDNLDRTIFKSAIFFNQFHFLFKNLPHFNQQIWRKKGKVFLKYLALSFRDPAHWELKLYIAKILKKWLTFSLSKKILENIKICLVYQPSKPNCLFYVLNPLKLCILTFELVHIIDYYFKSLGTTCTKMKLKIIRIAKKIQRNIKNEHLMKEAFLDFDLEKRQIISIVLYLEVFDLLENPFLHNIGANFWSGSYTTEGSFVEASSNHKILKTPFKEDEDVEVKYRFGQTIKNMKTHSFHFYIWKKSIFLRYSISFLIDFCLAFLFQVVMLNALESLKSMWDYVHLFRAWDEAAIYANYEGYVALYLQFEAQLQSTTNILFDSTALTMIYLAFPFKMIFDFIYYKANRDKYPLFSVHNILDILLILTTIQRFLYIILADNFRNGDTPCINYCVNKNHRYLDFYARKFYDVTYGIFMGILWLKLLWGLRVNRTLGPLIKIFEMMMKNIAVFMIIYFFQLGIFSCIANILFHNVGDFSSFYYSAITLFKGSLGDLYYDDFGYGICFEDNSNYQYIGEVFMTLFLMVNMILVLNFLIAILADTYSLYQSRGPALYLFELMAESRHYKYNKKYSFLVSSFFPLNCVTVSLYPFLCFLKNKETRNKVILVIQYLPIVLILVPFFLAYSVIILPFVFIKNILSKLYLLGCGKSNRWKLFGSLVFYLLFGLLISLMTLLIDCVIFIGHLYKGKSGKKDPEEETSKVMIRKCGIKAMTKFISVSTPNQVKTPQIATLNTQEYIRKVFQNQTDKPSLSNPYLSLGVKTTSHQHSNTLANLTHSFDDTTLHNQTEMAFMEPIGNFQSVSPFQKQKESAIQDLRKSLALNENLFDSMDPSLFTFSKTEFEIVLNLYANSTYQLHEKSAAIFVDGLQIVLKQKINFQFYQSKVLQVKRLNSIFYKNKDFTTRTSPRKSQRYNNYIEDQKLDERVCASSFNLYNCKNLDKALRKIYKKSSKRKQLEVNAKFDQCDLLLDELRKEIIAQIK